MTRSRNFALPHPAHEQVVLPRRKLVAGVERQPRWRNRRHPEDGRLLHPILVHLLVDARAQIEPAEADERPAVVLAWLEDVDLIATVRAILALPYLSGHRVNRQAQHVAMAHRIDLRPVSRAADERIVRWNR